jgi:hypothetical protein
MVSDTLTSLKSPPYRPGFVPVEDLEDAAQEAVRHQHARGVNIDQRDLALAGDRFDHVAAVDGLGHDARAGTSGRREFRISTGMLRSMAGITVAGCSTLAPK